MRTATFQDFRRLGIALVLGLGLLGLSGCQQLIDDLDVSQEGTPYPYVPGNPSASQTTYDTSSP